MKMPLRPPAYPSLLTELFAQPDGAERFVELMRQIGPAPGGKYRHWDTFRHSPPLEGYTSKEQWLAVKIARSSLYRPIPLVDAAGHRFQYAIPTPALEMLHRIDRTAGGTIQGSDQVTNPSTRDTYLFKSIVEEAITSSQLEGASTTRKAAKAMIQEGRAPRDRGERMVLNNYQGMLYVREFTQRPLTPELVIELQRRLTEETLDDPEAAGRLRTNADDIVIEDETGARLHTPPPAEQLADRLQTMCDFANGVTDTDFMPPAVRAIILHFWLGYDHPFVDGNGRTARALFYWAMARNGYWLCEYVSISRILKKARGQYARSFLYTETDDNDLTYFLLYQMRVLLRAIDDLHEFLIRKASELRETDELVRGASLANSALNPRQLTLIHHALEHPMSRYTVESHRISHGTSYETARSDLLGLAALGLLDKKKTGKAYLFTPAADLRSSLSARSS